MNRLLAGLLLGSLALLGLAGCFTLGRGHGPVDAVQFLASRNPGLDRNVTGIMNEQSDPVEVMMVVPPDLTDLNLAATFSLNTEAVISVISGGAPVVQQNGVTRNDFSAPVLYRVQVPGEREPWRYRVTVRSAETNAALSRISVPEGAGMSPLFSPRVKSYTVEVPYSATRVRIDATGQSQMLRSISIDGVSSGGPSASTSVDFSSGSSRLVSIETLAEDGATRDEYSVLLRRLPPDDNAKLEWLEIADTTLVPGFSPDRTVYRAQLPFAATEVVVKAKAQSRYAAITLQTLAIFGRPASGRVALPVRGAPADRAGGVVDFASGTVLPLIVAVTAEDGSVQEYFVEIQRAEPDHNNALADLAVAGSRMMPPFNPREFRYAVEVPYATRQIVVSAKAQSPWAVMELATGAAGGGPSAPGVPMWGDLAARGGATVDFPVAERIVLAVRVTAQDGRAAQYLLDVRRAPPDRNADLGALAVSAGVLTPIFSPRLVSYAISLPVGIDSVRITASAASDAATVAVEGFAGRPAAAQTFVVSVPAGGIQTVNLVVAAEDGTQKLYRIRVSREALGPGPGRDANTRLARLQLSGANLEPDFDPRVLDYQARVDRNVDAVTLTASAESPAAAITVDGQPLGRAGRLIALEPRGTRTVIVEVTADAGTIARTTIRLSREAGGGPPPAVTPGASVISVTLDGVKIARRELAALGGNPGVIGSDARFTVRPYRTSSVIAQGTARVTVRMEGGTPSVTAQWRSPGVRLEAGGLVEVEVAIPAGRNNWLCYTEARPAAALVALDVPFLLSSANPRVSWPALGSAVSVVGAIQVSAEGPRKPERQPDRETFALNQKGEYGVDVAFTDAATGRPLGSATLWDTPGLPRGHLLTFTRPVTLPEGARVRYTLTARAKNGKGWMASGTAQVWTTRLSDDGGFEPVVLEFEQGLAPQD